MNNYNVTKKVQEEYELMGPIIARNNTFIVLDLETTGLSPTRGGRIIEIGALKISNGKIIDEFSTFVNPDMKIPKSSYQVHGISNEMVSKYPVYQIVLKDFYEFIEDYPIVAHNSQFDWDRFLLYYFNKIGLYPNNESIDTIVLSKAILPAQEGDSMSLGDVCERCNVKLKNAHRAIHDAIATAEIFMIAKEIIDKSGKFSQNSLFDIIEVDNNNNKNHIKRQPILNANYWSKKTKDKDFQRIYVSLPQSQVFYDITGGYWEVKETTVKVDFNQIEKDVIQYLNNFKPNLVKYFKAKTA